jgi:hypothetical protein
MVDDEYSPFIDKAALHLEPELKNILEKNLFFIAREIACNGKVEITYNEDKQVIEVMHGKQP